jgi:S1-C subfamily serine protease
MAATDVRPSRAPRAGGAPAAPLHERIVPKSVLGLAVMILAFAIGSAFSGVAFYSYYEYKKDHSDELVRSYDQRFSVAEKTLQSETASAKSEIQKELEPIKKVQAEGSTLLQLSKQVKGAMFAVRTLDEAGQPSVGSGFAVASDNSQTLVLTSYTTVRAATRQPGPAISVKQGDTDIKATLWTWDEQQDMALLMVSKGNISKLSFAPRDPALALGDRVFAISGIAASGAAVTQGFVVDVSSTAIQHDARIGPSFQGGPLLNSKGEVIAMASRGFSPLGFGSDAVYFAPPVRAACSKLLRCPDEQTVSGAGAKR